MYGYGLRGTVVSQGGFKSLRRRRAGLPFIGTARRGALHSTPDARPQWLMSVAGCVVFPLLRCSPA